MPLGPHPTGQMIRLRRTENREAPPPDFDEFWGRTLSALSAVAPDPQQVLTREICSEQADLYSILSWGQTRVRCWFSHRCADEADSGKSVPRPLLVTTHGYGGASQPERVRRLSALGFDVVAIDVRGFGLSRSSVPHLSPYGYIMTGADSRETSILRGAICDLIQAYRAALQHFGPPSRVGFEGFSLAGGFCTMATAVLSMAARNWGEIPLPKPPELLAIGAPTFGKTERRLALCKGGSGSEMREYLRQNPLRRHEVLRVFSYFDTVFFAPYIGTYVDGKGVLPARVIAGVGVFDPIVPAETVFAVFNSLAVQAEIFELPCSHTENPEEAEWIRWESAWIKALRADDPEPQPAVPIE